MSLDVDRHVVPDRTIVGLLEGSDPQLKQEVVIVSAHHDHQGAEGDQIFNGADDNVSGTAAVIDIAEAYVLAAQAGVRPKRSILFAVFGSEERGPLLGIPVTTKDSHWTAGLESTSGSRTRVGHVPAETMGAIERLERAGAVIFARTTTPEFCYFGITESELFGSTANPIIPPSLATRTSDGDPMTTVAPPMRASMWPTFSV